MSAARLAEPGERFILLGHPHAERNGETGRVIRVLSTFEARLAETMSPGRPEFHLPPYAEVEMDSPLEPLERDTCLCLPRRWLWCIDPDGDDLDGEDLRDIERLTGTPQEVTP